jgi:PAS domain S-box-containing protein
MFLEVFEMNSADRTKDEFFKLYRAVECSEEAIFMTDPDGLITFINPGFTKLYGFSSEEVVGKTTPRILKSGKMMADEYKFFWETILSNQTVRGEHINKTKDGKFLSVEGSANPILNDQQKIIGFIGIQHDVTSRKQSEEDLKKSEEKFRKASNTSPDAIIISRLSDGMMITVNAAFTKTLGYSEKDAIGKTSFELNLWADKNDRNYVLNELEKNGRVENYEITFLKKDGGIINGLLSAALIELEGVAHILTVTKDISLRKQIEKKLEKEQFLINSLMNNLTDHVYFKDINSRFIRNNKSHAISFGFNDPDQLIGKSDFDFFTEHAARQAYNDEQLIIKTGESILKEEKLTRKDGTVAWFSAMKLPLHDNTGKIIGTFGISRDITEWKKTEQENLVNYEITQGITLTSNLDELLKIIHNSLRKVVYAENFFIALYNRNTDLFDFPYFIDKLDSTPLPIFMRKSCSAFVFRTVKPLLLTQQIFDQLVEKGEVELVGSNSPSWVGIPLQTPSRVIGVAVLQHYEKENVYSENDVRFLVSIGSQIAMAIERKKAEEEITHKNELLQTINAEKDKFFSIIAHDLRGPLSAFVEATQIISEEVYTMSIDELKDITGSMKTSATNIYSLLENLLEWSRLRRGAMVFSPERIYLRKYIDDCIIVLSESARKKSINIEANIPVEMEIMADRNMFGTVIRNLVSNAIKFTTFGGKISITASYNNDQSLVIEINDSGIGIPAELKNRLFQINEKTSRPGTDGEPSTGLGLLLCKEFIEKHDGRIWVESEEGKGSIFSFTIKQYGNINS